MNRVRLEANPVGFLFANLYLSQPVWEVLAPGSSRIVVWVVYFAEVSGAGGGRMPVLSLHPSQAHACQSGHLS